MLRSEQALRDETTGLPNRRALLRWLDELGKEPALAVLLVDFDGLRAVNNVLGHQAGDVLIRRVAAGIRESTRQDDLVARLHGSGGDEFVVCCPGLGEGEAMAGVVRSGRYPQMSAENGVKSDHFVGYCYADYVKNGASLGLASDHPADSLTREVDVRDDSADELLQRVLNGDQSALELWSQTRAWVISGQRKTLARLGIYFDRVFFESDFLPEVAELSNLGLEHGMLQRRPDGAVIYLTDREELEEMPLLRADGLPTQHMRALAYWMAAPGLEGTTSIQVCGLEWVAHVTCRRQLMDEMMAKGAGADINHPKHDIFHGMVSKQSESVSSSKKNALLIDELAEWIDSAIENEPERVDVRHEHPAAEQIVPQVALGYFLMHTNTNPLDFEPEKNSK